MVLITMVAVVIVTVLIARLIAWVYMVAVETVYTRAAYTRVVWIMLWLVGLLLVQWPFEHLIHWFIRVGVRRCTLLVAVLGVPVVIVTSPVQVRRFRDGSSVGRSAVSGRFTGSVPTRILGVGSMHRMCRVILWTIYIWVRP